MFNNKKAQGLSITTIILAVIALIVLVVLVAMFTGRFGAFSAGIEGTSGGFTKTCEEQGGDLIEAVQCGNLDKKITSKNSLPGSDNICCIDCSDVCSDIEDDDRYYNCLEDCQN